MKTKVFRQAAGCSPLEPNERQALALECLTGGPGATPRQLAALAQAKIAFVTTLFELCAAYRCRAFASIVPRDAPRPTTKFLRKDYAYLFERFFYFLEDQGPEQLGLVVFDELERSQSHILVDEMRTYFLETQTGRMRSGTVVPEPFFVHSDLTTGIQLADFVAYIVAWGVSVGDMAPAYRSDLEDLGNLVCTLRHRSLREMHGNPNFSIWSFAVIQDLRPRDERELR